jgi:hypothetical protein
MINAFADGRVDLYYDNAIKLTTTTTGIDVTGTATTDGVLSNGGGINDIPLEITHSWGASGTPLIKASNASSEVFRVQRNGAVGIGTSSPATVTGGIHVVHNAGEGTPTAIGDEVGIFQRNAVAAQSVALSLISGTASTSSIYFGDKDDIDVGKLAWSNSSNSFSFNGGNVGIGTSTITDYSGSVLQIHAASGSAARIKLTNSVSGTAQGDGGSITYDTSNDLYMLNRESGNVLFGTAALERMRIDANGNLLVGTTTPTGKVTVNSNATTVGISATNTTGDQTATTLKLVSARGDVFYHAMFFRSNTTEVFRVEANGNVKNTNNSYGALSDVKLKENITDASPKLADLMQVRVRNYNLIDDDVNQLGVIAQELETVFPSMVDENEDRDFDGNFLGTTTKGVKYSVFVPMLIKAIQEQQTLIESLTTRIAALEE